MKGWCSMTKKAKRRRVIVRVIEQLIGLVLIFAAMELVILAAAFLCRLAGVL